LALKTGFQIAKEQGLTNLEVETDSTDAINCLENGMTIFNNIIFECRSSMNQVKVQGIHHIFREANKLAHMIARRTLCDNKGSDLTILYYPPHFASNVLRSDSEGATHLIKNIRKDVCSRLAYFGNKNVFRDMLCNSQVVNVPPDNYACMNSTIM
ncbi:hypothetical protein A4A49_56677, partial [Nicotiana attenuata]